MDAKDARDEALERVKRNNRAWLKNAMHRLATFVPGNEYTGEEIRLRLRLEVGEPHHHNAWGAFIRSAIVSHGLLVPTGKYRNMATKKSHARLTPVYKRSNVQPEEGV